MAKGFSCVIRRIWSPLSLAPKARSEAAKKKEATTKARAEAQGLGSDR